MGPLIATALPSKWGDIEIRRVAWVRARLGWKGLTAAEYVDNGIPMLATPNIKDELIDYQGANKITQDRYEESPEIKLSPGDVLLTKDGSTIGTVNRVRELLEPATVNGSIAVLTPTGDLDSRFLYWFFVSSYAQSIFDRLRGGMGLPHLFQRDINRIRMPLPPMAEQRAIADYLDRETARIDTLIEEQQRLIDLLHERRAAMIVHAVGHGFDSTAQTKPSGLFWTKIVPAHWKVVNLRKVATIKTGHTPSRSNPEYWVDCHVPWFSLADVWQLRSGRKNFVAETSSRISELGLANSAAELLPAGTVILSRTASVGFSGIMSVPMATSQDFWNWIPGERLDGAYLMWVFRAMRKEFDSLMIGSTHKTIYRSTVAALNVPLPPLDEQRCIAAYLDEQTSRIDRLIVESQRFVELCRERRAALVTAAVTGQIDVREAA